MRGCTVLLAALTLLSACKPAHTAVETHRPQPSSTPALELREPLVRLTQLGGWEGPHDLEIPTFTLYADGLVIFARGEGDDARAMQVHLSKEETYALLDRANAALAELPERTRLLNATDQPMSTIGVTHQGRIYSVGMYGYGSDGAEDAPRAFTTLHETLEHWDHPDAVPWSPDELTISLFRVDDGRATAWPEGLPQPPADAREPRERTLGRSGTTIRQPLRYRVSGTLEDPLTDAIPDPSEGRTVAWNGALWRLRYHRVVPAEQWYW